MTPLSFDDADVHAYADGQLAPERRAAFEAALARDPGLASRVAAIRDQSAALRSALDPVLSEPVPERLVSAATPPARSPRPPLWRRMAPALASAAMLVVGVAIGWYGRTLDLANEGTPVSFAQQAAYTHALYASDANRPVEVWANEEKRLVNWLTRRIGHPVHAPDLTSLGFSLVGGRLVAGNEKPTALFMYESPERERLSLQVRWAGTRQGDTGFRYAIENGVGVFYWIDESFSYALSGGVDRARLLLVARVVHGQLAAADAGKVQRPALP